MFRLADRGPFCAFRGAALFRRRTEWMLKSRTNLDVVGLWPRVISIGGESDAILGTIGIA